MTKKEQKLEESMAKLEEIVTHLETGEHTLEESLEKFEEGLELGKRCREILDQAEMRIRKLVDVDEEGNRTDQEFEDEQ